MWRSFFRRFPVQYLCLSNENCFCNQQAISEKVSEQRDLIKQDQGIQLELKELDHKVNKFQRDSKEAATKVPFNFFLVFVVNVNLLEIGGGGGHCRYSAPFEHICEAMSIIFMMTITMMMTSTTMTAMNLCMNKNFNKPIRLFEDKFSWAFD